MIAVVAAGCGPGCAGMWAGDVLVVWAGVCAEDVLGV